MTRNAENHQAIVTGEGAFRGISRAAGPAAVPDGFLYGGQNFICDEPLGEARTRNGYAPIYYGTIPLMKIMPNARLQWIPPWLKPPHIIIDDQENFALTIGAAPNTDLYVNADHTPQNVTFYVQGTAVAGISGNYSWTYGDGDTESGAATSVNHDYTEAGTMQVTVSAVHDDGNTYKASLTIIIEDRPIIVDGQGGNKIPEVDVKVNGSDETVDIPAAANVTVTWTTTNCTQVYLNGALVARSGSDTVHVGDPGEPTYFLLVGYSAEGLQATDMVLVIIDGDDEEWPPVDELPRTLKIVGQDTAYDGETITLAYQMWARRTPESAEELAPTTGDLDCDHNSGFFATSDGSAGYYGERLAFADEKTKDNSDTIKLELTAGHSEEVVRIFAQMPVYPYVKGFKDILVSVPNYDIDVNIADVDGDDFSQLDDHQTAAQVIYLELDAHYFGTSTTDSGFEKNVRLTLELDDYASAPAAANGIMEVTFDAIWLAVDMPSAVDAYAFSEPGLIPAALWQESLDPGKLVVQVSVNLPVIEAFNTNSYKVYQLITFTATVEDA